MKLVSLTCTKCGAKLEVNPELTKCMCQFCGNEMLIDHEVQQHEHTITNGFAFGYEQEMGRQQALADLRREQVQAQQKLLDDQQRLIDTPTGQKERHKLSRALKRPLSDAELGQILREKLETDPKLRQEYENGETAPEWMRKGNRPLYIDSAVCFCISVLGFCLPVFPAFVSLIGMILGLMASCGIRSDKRALSIAVTGLNLIVFVVGLLITLSYITDGGSS